VWAGVAQATWTPSLPPVPVWGDPCRPSSSRGLQAASTEWMCVAGPRQEEGQLPRAGRTACAGACSPQGSVLFVLAPLRTAPLPTLLPTGPWTSSNGWMSIAGPRREESQLPRAGCTACTGAHSPQGSVLSVLAPLRTAPRSRSSRLSQSLLRTGPTARPREKPTGGLRARAAGATATVRDGALRAPGRTYARESRCCLCSLRFARLLAHARRVSRSPSTSERGAHGRKSVPGSIFPAERASGLGCDIVMPEKSSLARYFGRRGRTRDAAYRSARAKPSSPVPPGPQIRARNSLTIRRI
jgi:hypothetical protein